MTCQSCIIVLRRHELNPWKFPWDWDQNILCLSIWILHRNRHLRQTLKKHPSLYVRVHLKPHAVTYPVWCPDNLQEQYSIVGRFFGCVLLSVLSLTFQHVEFFITSTWAIAFPNHFILPAWTMIWTFTSERASQRHMGRADSWTGIIIWKC